MPLIHDAKKLDEMAQVSAQFGHRDASGRLADLVEKVMKEQS